MLYHRRSRPVRIAVLCSGSASSMRFLYEQDDAYGEAYEFVGVLSDVPGAKGLQYAKERDIPSRCLDFAKWLKQHHVGRKNIARRALYYRMVLQQMWEWEVEAVILSGWMLLVTDPLLNAYLLKILNVHPALLSIGDGHGGRLLTGLGVVAKAMELGLPTGSTVHLLTEEADMGPIVTESLPLAYSPGDDPDEHQEKMKFACDGPAFRLALRTMIARGWPEVPFQEKA